MTDASLLIARDPVSATRSHRRATGAPCGEAGHAGRWAAVTWLVLLGPAFGLAPLLHRSPFSRSGTLAPLLVGVLALGVVAHVARGRRPDVGTGVAAGAFAAWVLYALRAALYGTPLPFVAGGDTTRLEAMAERYTTTLRSTDGIVASVPSDYPPLFPWIVGRLSVLTGIPAWRLVAPAEMVLASMVVVVGFALWRRLLSDRLALGVTLVTFAIFLTPAKAYEWMALELVIPWTLATFVTAHGRRRLGWPVAGVLGGLQIVLYQGYLMFLALGIVALVVISWRRSADRRAYAAYVAKVALVMFAVAAWFIVPYASWWLTHGLQMTDRYRDPMIDEGPYVALSLTPMGLIGAVGVVGIVRYRDRTWWARPLLWLLLSAFVFRVVGRIELRRTGETLVFPYTVHPISAALVVAGMLTLATGGPALARRLSITPERLAGLALAVLAVVVGTWAWTEWSPGAAVRGITLPAVPGTGSAPVSSFLTPLPDGRYPRFAPAAGRQAWFPSDLVVADVDRALGARAAPLTLSWSEQLFAAEPWPGYIGVGANAAASTSHWFSRLATLRRLATITDPAAFATASAHTPYGAIDVLVLHDDGHGHWDWTPVNGPAAVRFTPHQFSSPAFTVDRDLPDATELVIRRAVRMSN